jgi:uncharacterized protein
MIGTVLGALAIAVVAGLLTGLFGVGGGFLVTPLLNVVLGLPMPIAVGTGVMNILGVSTAGLYWRRKSNLADYKLALVLFGGNVSGVYFGSRTLESFKALGTLQLNGTPVAAADFYTLLLLLALLMAIFVWMFLETRRAGPANVRVGLFSRIGIPPYATFRGLEAPRLSIPVLAYFGVLAGYLTGLLGVGGGIILLPALVYLVGMRTHRAIVTSLFMVWLTSLVATVTHAAQGNADLTVLMVLLVGGSAGFQIGMTICGKLDGPKLRRYFCFVVLGVSGLVATRLLAALI